MMESEAWRALPLGARHVIDRVMLEHMAHAGTANGELTVTYDDFAQYGLSSRRMTAQSIRIAIALGFLDVVEPGVRSFGAARRATRYGLTWLPRRDRTPASNRWKRIATTGAAKQAIRFARDRARVSTTMWVPAKAA
jgi:hypothetical protein